MQNGGNKVEKLPPVLYGYRKRTNGTASSLLRLVYEVNPRMLANEALVLIGETQT